MKDYKIKQGYRIYKSGCFICGRKYFPDEMNGIYKNSGHHYYCHKKECQKRFIEDAGDFPELDDY